MRKVSGMVFIVMMALLLVACGGGDEEDTDTGGDGGDTGDSETVVATTEPTETEETQVAEDATSAVGSASPESSPAAGEATPEGTTGGAASPEAGVMSGSTPVASPVSSTATGATSEASPSGMATPAMVSGTNAATPMAGASPVTSTPAAVAVVEPESDGSPVASPEATAVASVTLDGRVELAGAENTAWTMSGEGCVGLGSNSSLGTGDQVVIRDEAGVIIGVTELQASDETDACVWTFKVDVQESDYYAVSIPMQTELVFSHDQIKQSGGEITIIMQ